jgi:hypothetical protein
LRLLNAELTSLETELADPSNPLLQKEREEDNVDPGELIKDLVVVRGRLDKIRKKHEGRARLIGTVLANDRQESESEDENEDPEDDLNTPEASKMRNLIDIDKRVGELEKLIGSSNATLDEVKCMNIRRYKFTDFVSSKGLAPSATSIAFDHASQLSTRSPHTTSAHRLYFSPSEASLIRP